MKSKHHSIIQFYVSLTLILISSFAYSQTPCDTIFTKSGEMMLVNPYHFKFKKNIKYYNCEDLIKSPTLKIPSDLINRIGLNSLKTDLWKKPKKEVFIHFQNQGKTWQRGNLIGIRDSSVIITQRIKGTSKVMLTEYPIVEIEKLRMHRNRLGPLPILIGIAAGLFGGAVAFGFSEDYTSALVGGSILGLGIGGVASALGNISFNIEIKGDQKRFKEEMEKRKFLIDTE